MFKLLYIFFVWQQDCLCYYPRSNYVSQLHAIILSNNIYIYILTGHCSLFILSIGCKFIFLYLKVKKKKPISKYYSILFTILYHSSFFFTLFGYLDRVNIFHRWPFKGYNSTSVHWKYVYAIMRTLIYIVVYNI